MPALQVGMVVSLARSVEANFYCAARAELAKNKVKNMSDVINNRLDHRFELTVDGYLAAAYYKLDGNVITFVHTEVPPELGGKGVGSKLVQGALDQVRSQGMKVIADCPFVKAWIGKHPEYKDLLTA